MLEFIINWENNQPSVMDWAKLYWSLHSPKSVLKISLDHHHIIIKAYKVVFLEGMIINYF